MAQDTGPAVVQAVGAIVDQVDPMRMLSRYPRLAEAVADNLRVDIPADDLSAWAELVLRMKDGRLLSLPITNEVVDVVDPDFDLIRSLVEEAITSPPRAPTTSTGTTTPTPTDGATDGATGTSTEEPTIEPTDELADLGATC